MRRRSGSGVDMLCLRFAPAGVVALTLAFAATWSAAAATAPSGIVVAVVQSSQADGQTGRRVLTVEAPVYSGDRIVTGPVGEAQVRFRDDTKLVVGPNSRMTIDAFVFNGDNTARSISINAAQGAFRFITGVSRKDAYSIATPTATIGVRGTEFDFNVDTAGATSVAVFKGITRVCDRRKRSCVEQRAGCNISVVEPGSDPRRITELPERQRLQRSFRYVQSQRSLVAAFRVDVSSCRINRAEIPTTGAPAVELAAEVAPPPPPPPPPPPEDEGDRCDGNCGAGFGNGGGNGTDNEGGGKGPPDGKPGRGPHD